MSVTADPKFQALAKAWREQASTPQAKLMVEDALARMERTPAYYAALGEFVTNFSRVEVTLQQALWLVAGVQPKIARAIFSGLKVEGCLQFIKRVADATEWEKPQQRRLEEITKRLGPLNKLRNDILHHGVSVDHNTPDAWLFSNRPFAHIPAKVREFSITPTLLDDASADLTKIWYLSMALSLHVRDAKLARAMEKRFREQLRRAWRYKQPPPAKTGG